MRCIMIAHILLAALAAGAAVDTAASPSLTLAQPDAGMVQFPYADVIGRTGINPNEISKITDMGGGENFSCIGVSKALAALSGFNDTFGLTMHDYRDLDPTERTAPIRSVHGMS